MRLGLYPLDGVKWPLRHADGREKSSLNFEPFGESLSVLENVGAIAGLLLLVIEPGPNTRVVRSASVVPPNPGSQLANGGSVFWVR